MQVGKGDFIRYEYGVGTCFLKGDDLELPAGGVPEPLYGDGEGGAEEAGEVAPLQELGGERPRVQQPGVSHLTPAAPAQHAPLPS